MFRWIAAGLLVIAIAVGAFFLVRARERDARATGDPETRIINYLKENVKPGQPVLVTELYNNVFTSPEERDTIDRLFALFLKIPAAAAETYRNTGKIPTLQELADQFQLKVPGEADVLLRIMESDPRMPQFFERNPATGEITRIYVDRIAADERFGKPLRNQ